ncbi:MAG: GNAT family N-acetyltransferase [Candidatus Aminicenantes bacterium]|nr:GNAT family N-acetyltransferase [Candidatus Aminicenantes bacterium]
MKVDNKPRQERIKIKIRPLRHYPEFEECVAIQKEVWKLEDVEATPVHQFCLGTQMGHILLGAFIQNQLVGFVYSFPSIFQGRLSHHSHLLAVRPQYQGLGIGKKLKWAQREVALKLGLDLITWTVDPLQAKNANLNLRTLGAITRIYWDNFYGYSPALLLGPNIPTDRFLMEWWIKSPRVTERLKEAKGKKFQQRKYQIDELTIAVNSELLDPGRLKPDKVKLKLKDEIIFISLPNDIRSYSQEPWLIAAWQQAIRKAMKHYFKQGYAVSDFIFGDRSFYVLERLEKIKGLNLRVKR